MGQLTAAEELEVGAQIAASDDALRRLVEANLRLVITVARRYCHAGIALQDLIQEGSVGLVRAAQTFDSRKGYRFSTDAIRGITQAVSRAVATPASAIRVPLHRQEGMGQAERARAAPGTGSTAPVVLAAATVELARRAASPCPWIGSGVRTRTAARPWRMTPAPHRSIGPLRRSCGTGWWRCCRRGSARSCASAPGWSTGGPTPVPRWGTDIPHARPGAAGGGAGSVPDAYGTKRGRVGRVSDLTGRALPCGAGRAAGGPIRSRMKKRHDTARLRR